MEYSCSKEVAGLTVEVRWHVDHIDSIEVWLDGKYFETAVLSHRPTSLPRLVAVEESNYPTVESAKVRLEQLRKVGGVEPIALRTDEFLTVKEFVQLLARYLERGVSSAEEKRLELFFKVHAPMRRNEIDEGLKKAVSVKGCALHLRYYLEQLETVLRRGKKK